MTDTIVISEDLTTLEVISSPQQVVEIVEPVTNVLEIAAMGPQGPGGVRGLYGSFYDSTDQNAPTATPQAIALGSTAEALGISIENGNEIVISEAGTYSMTFSIQFANYDNAPHEADVWVRYQGTDFPDSATRFDIPARKSATIPGHLVGTVNYVATSAPGGRIKLMWLDGSSLLQIKSYPATGSIPAVPGIIVTLTQVMYAQQGPKGDPGEPGPQGDPGPQGEPGPAGTAEIGGFPTVIAGAAAGDLLGFNGTNWYNRPSTDVSDGGNF